MQRLGRSDVISGYRAELDPRARGFDLTAIVRIKPAPGRLVKCRKATRVLRTKAAARKDERSVSSCRFR